MSDRISLLGTSPPRCDGQPKAAGQARYLDDLDDTGVWYGATVRSPHPHARITSIRFDPAAAPDGALCVTASDIDGNNGLKTLDDIWPLLADREVHHVGEAVALVVARDAEGASRAAAAVEVEYEALEAVLDWEQAESVDPLHSLALDQGDAVAVLEDAEIVVEGEYFTGHQEHIYIECQAMQAHWDADGTLVVQGSIQCPYYVKTAMLHAFELPEDKVRVKACLLGGGFGGKEDYPSMLAAHCAFLSRACGHPVRMVYDRHEDIVATTKRHPSHTRIRTAVGKDGEVLAARVDFDLDGGAYLGLSPVVLSRGILHATGPYRVGPVRIRGRVLQTNTPPNGAFRGFGAPQSEFAWERHMDHIARQLGLDPLTVRRRNVLRVGDKLPTGQVMDESCSASAVLDRIESMTDFSARWSEFDAKNAGAPDDGTPRRGLGLSLSFHGAGFTGLGEQRMRSPVSARLRKEDGRLELLCAATEMGQGALSTLPLLAAEASGLRPEQIVLAEPDTLRVPDSGPTVASRTSMIVGSGAARVTSELADRVLRWNHASDPAEWSLAGGIVYRDGEAHASFDEHCLHFLEAGGDPDHTVRHEAPSWQSFDEESYHGSAYPTYSYAAQVIDLEVDPDTLEVHTTEAAVVAEVGRVIHEVQCRGQVEGGTLQAIGYALLEEMKLENGRYLNDRLATYIVPTILDAPKMRVELMEAPWEGPPFGAKGVGELPMDGAAPAVCAAIENAIGVSVDRIPATAERILECLPEGARP
jgi:CO/xanthine dehydrogenase Mo-binding subunit